MLQRYWYWGLVLSLGGILAAGCGSAGASRRSAAPSPPLRTTVSTGEPTDEQFARAHAHYAAGVLHEMNDEGEAALKEYELAALGDPDNDWLVLEVSRRLLQAKQPERALDLLNKAAARPKASGAVLGRLAMVYSQLGKYDQAVTVGRAAIKKSPDSIGGYQTLLITFLQTKQETEALRILDEAAGQRGVDAEFLLGLSELYATLAVQVPAQKATARAKAIASLERTEKLRPTDVSQRVRLADGFNVLGESEKAAQLYLELLKKLPDVPAVRERVHAKLADIYLQSKEPKRAMAQLEAVLRDDPTNPQVYFYLGSLAYDAKETAKAADCFRKAILLNPDFEQAYYDLALAQLGQDKADEALATLAQARKKFPQNFVQEFWMALAYSRQKEYKTALAHFTSAEVIAKATDPKRLTHVFFFEAGAAAERCGDFVQAEEYFEKCLKLAPDFTEAMNYLGYMWAEHGLNLEHARELIEKAVKAEPKNPAFLDSLAWVLYKLHRPSEALGYALKAIELSQQPEAALYDHLGDIYTALNQGTKAREAWTKSLSIESSEEVRKKLAPGVEH
jgi:tetratricopeptide (TPR) repeat protein